MKTTGFGRHVAPSIALGTANFITLSRIEILRTRTRINNKNTDNDSSLLGSRNVNW